MSQRGVSRYGPVAELRAAELAEESKDTTTAVVNNASENGFNCRRFWPDVIRIPENRWVYSCKEIVDKLGNDAKAAGVIKKKMEKCLMYFYMMKKSLRLFDHTYTAACILFFRYWYLCDLPQSMLDSIHLSQAILATACKATENNRPVDMYVKATCEFIMKEGIMQSPGSLTGSSMQQQQQQQQQQSRNRQNMDKLKWDVRDKLVSYEKQLLCQFGFDLDLQNPKELIEETFNGFYRFNRDQNMDANFKRVFPKILAEARTFIIQAGTQPVSLLCDGYTFTALALLYAGLQCKRITNPDFKFPKNFFKERFPICISSRIIVSLFTDYRILEENFFDLKSNKGEGLKVTMEEMSSLIDEDVEDDKEAGDRETEETVSNSNDPFDYENIKSGECTQEFLDHTKAKLHELKEKLINESMKKRPITNDDTAKSKDDFKRLKM